MPEKMVTVTVGDLAQSKWRHRERVCYWRWTAKPKWREKEGQQSSRNLYGKWK